MSECIVQLFGSHILSFPVLPPARISEIKSYVYYSKQHESILDLVLLFWLYD